jgi:hypothetical protein
MAGLLALQGCADLQHKINDTLATKVTAKIQARNAEAGALHSTLIVADVNERSEGIAHALESSMTRLRVDEKPFYSNVKLGLRLPQATSEVQLVQLARSQGLEAVVVVTHAATDVKATNSTEDRSVCAVETKLLQACPKGQSHNTKVTCTTTVGQAAVRLRVIRVADGRSVVADTVGGDARHYVCADHNMPPADHPALVGSALQNLADNVMRIVAPGYVQVPLDLVRADASLPADKAKAFEAAYKFADAKRLDEACQRYETLYADLKESKALTFNVGFCAEARGDLLAANQLYRRASELANEPDAQIDRRLGVTEKALRESPVAFGPLIEAARAQPAAVPSNGKRVALVVGNSRYKSNALVNPVNDARLIGTKLKSLGFDVTVVENADSSRFATATRDFGQRAKGADVAMFFYAGHAVQVDGENYLMPVNNDKIRSMDDVRDNWGVQLADVLAQLDVAAPRVKVVVLDACRNNPLPSSTRSVGGGLAALKTPPQGALIAFATTPGDTTPDGVGKNSIYTKHLADQLTVPNQSIEQVFKNVRSAVMAETKGRQKPNEVSSLIGELHLATAQRK